MSEMLFRLEYSEKDGVFHLEWLGKAHPAKPNTFGYNTICDRIEDEKATEFLYKIEKKYFNKSSKYPTLAQIIAEFESFNKPKSAVIGFCTIQIEAN